MSPASSGARATCSSPQPSAATSTTAAAHKSTEGASEEPAGSALMLLCSVGMDSGVAFGLRLENRFHLRQAGGKIIHHRPIHGMTSIPSTFEQGDVARENRRESGIRTRAALQFAAVIQSALPSAKGHDSSRVQVIQSREIKCAQRQTAVSACEQFFGKLHPGTLGKLIRRDRFVR